MSLVPTPIDEFRYPDEDIERLRKEYYARRGHGFYTEIARRSGMSFVTVKSFFLGMSTPSATRILLATQEYLFDRDERPKLEQQRRNNL